MASPSAAFSAASFPPRRWREAEGAAAATPTPILMLQTRSAPQQVVLPVIKIIIGSAALVVTLWLLMDLPLLPAARRARHLLRL